MDLGVVSKVFSKVGATNINTAAFPSRVPTITEPTPSATAAVVQLAAREWGGGGEIPMAVLLLPYGLVKPYLHPSNVDIHFPPIEPNV